MTNILKWVRQQLLFRHSHGGTDADQPTILFMGSALLSSVLPLSGSIAVCKSTRPHPVCCAVLSVAKIVERCATDRLVGARGAVLPSAKCCPANGVGRSTQAWLGAGIDISASHTVARRARSIAEIIEICLANRLFRSAERIEVSFPRNFVFQG